MSCFWKMKNSTAGTTLINTPYKGGRNCSDYIAVID